MSEKNVQQEPEKSKKSSGAQYEDAALKITMQYFAEEILPYLGIEGKVVGFAPTELVHLEIKKLFQDFNLEMEDGGWKHFEFQSKDEGIPGLKRFRLYESMASYQHGVEVTTYVLYSGNIIHPVSEFTEGINTYHVIPITLQNKNADEVLKNLQKKVENGEMITKADLVPLTLCPLMGGESAIKDRIKTAYAITREAEKVDKESVGKVEAVLFAMAEKFLESIELDEVMEAMRLTRMGQKLINEGIKEGMEKGMEEGISRGKLESARSFIDLLDEKVIADRLDLPLETVQRLKQER